MNKLDLDYRELLSDILKNGTRKEDRTGTGTISVFGRTIRHDMKSGFPLLTTKRIKFDLVVTELIWFLRGDTNIKYLVDNDCHIWDGDAYKKYEKSWEYAKSMQKQHSTDEDYQQYLKEINILSKEEFINKIKTDDEFANKWGDLGPVYGKQWRKWEQNSVAPWGGLAINHIDQIANLINDLKTNPDSRRLMVNAWNVGELDQMVLPPCHTDFQFYTRELSLAERLNLVSTIIGEEKIRTHEDNLERVEKLNIPTRAISLMFNMRSCDTFLGLPFNIASYGLLLEIIAKEVNMVPDELIGNLGDVHLYSNHIEQAKEQIGRELSEDERYNLLTKQMTKLRAIKDEDYIKYNIPTRTREPFELPTINFNTEWWDKPFFEAIHSEAFCKCLLEDDIQLGNYKSHPTIKAPLSN